MQNAEVANRSGHSTEPVLPDTTVPPVIPETLPPPRDPRPAAKDPRSRDPRLKGKTHHHDRHSSSHMPHSTSIHPFSPDGLEGHNNIVPPADGPQIAPHGGAVPPFVQRHFHGPQMMGPGPPGFLPPQVVAPSEGHFRGEVYHPDSSDDSDSKRPDVSSRLSKDKLTHKEPATNRRDPRQVRKETEQRFKHGDNFGSFRDNKDSTLTRSSNRNSKERDRDPRRSRSPHTSSVNPRLVDGARDNKLDSRDPRLKQHSNEEHRKENVKHEHAIDKRHNKNEPKTNTSRSPIKHRSSPDKRDNKRLSKDRENSPVPEKSPKYSKKTDISEPKTDKDKPVKSDGKTSEQTVVKEKETAGRSSKERSKSPSKEKVRNRNENAKKSGSVERTEVEKVEEVAPVKTPKRELEKDEARQGEVDENENSSKKPRIEITEEKPTIVEGADVIGKIQEDIR